MKQTILTKIERREIVAGVVGLGYVGLPLAVEKAKSGFKTIGFDIQSCKVQQVNEGKNYIGDVVDSVLGCGVILKNAVGFVGVIIISLIISYLLRYHKEKTFSIILGLTGRLKRERGHKK